jgi:hypothetical protein
MHADFVFHVNLKGELPYGTMHALVSILVQMEWFKLQKV